MIESQLSRAATAMQGAMSGEDAAFRGVSTDSRTLEAGQLFVALRGPNFDGAKFAGEVAGRGAAGIVVQSDVDTSLPAIRVADTRLALGRLAADWRARMPATIIGITGSNGKTTLKELLASCLRQSANTLATAGNLNNDIGLPLMLLRLSGEHRFAVMEMGANHAGEIAYLVGLASPAIVAINNAGPAHLEGFGSLDGVARAKGEILQNARRPEAAVLNADDRYFDFWCDLASDVRIVSFGYSEAATVRLHNVRAEDAGSSFELRVDGEETLAVRLPLPGAHNVMNACAAAAVAYAAGLQPADIVAGLETVRPVKGRLQPLRGVRGIKLFDDSYNANPASVIAAAEYLAAQPGKAWMVLGDMGELGADEAGMHRAVGADIRRAGVQRLFATGPLARSAVEGFGSGAQWFASTDELATALADALTGDERVLVKGSRSMRMERVVAALTDRAANDGGQ